MLIDFYGLECPHCHNMEPLVARLEKEANVKVDRIEVWHNEENAKKMEGYDKGRCGGVPFFMNTDTGAMICGEVPYEDLKSWAGVK
jgi:thiol-disulfide isomerase/thioredoxin